MGGKADVIALTTSNTSLTGDNAIPASLKLYLQTGDARGHAHFTPRAAGQGGRARAVPRGQAHSGEVPRVEKESTGLMRAALPGLVRIELSPAADSGPAEHKLLQRELHKRPQREQVER